MIDRNDQPPVAPEHELARRIAEVSGEHLEVRTDEHAALRLFRAAFEAAPGGLLAVDRGGTIQLANREAENLFGYSREQLTGASIDDLVPTGRSTRHRSLMKSFWTAPSSRSMGGGATFPARRRDGSSFLAEVALRPVQVGEIELVLAVVVDRTEAVRSARALEESNRSLRRSNAALEEFAYAASHDMREPLRGIATLAAWIAEEIGPEAGGSALEHLAELRARVAWMSDLLDGLQTFAQAGSDAIGARPVALSRMVDGALDTLDTPPGFVVRVEPEGAELYVAPAPFEQVVCALVGNAIGHHDRDRGQVVVRCRQRSGWYVVEVEDDGPGIPANHRTRVFNMFESLKPGRSNTGVGLAVVRRWVTSVGGDVGIDAATERGTIVRFTWPNGRRPLDPAASRPGVDGRD